MDEAEERRLLEDLAVRLRRRHPEVGDELVRMVVRDSHARFADAHVRDFVPLLVERRAVQQLGTLTTVVAKL